MTEGQTKKDLFVQVPYRYLLLIAEGDWLRDGRDAPTMNVYPFREKEAAEALGQRLYDHHRDRRFDGHGGMAYVGVMDLLDTEHYDNPEEVIAHLDEYDEEFNEEEAIEEGNG